MAFFIWESRGFCNILRHFSILCCCLNGAMPFVQSAFSLKTCLKWHFMTFAIWVTKVSKHFKPIFIFCCCLNGTMTFVLSAFDIGNNEMIFVIFSYIIPWYVVIWMVLWHLLYQHLLFRHVWHLFQGNDKMINIFKKFSNLCFVIWHLLLKMSENDPC